MDTNSYTKDFSFFLENTALYALLLLDPDGIVTKINPATERLFEYSTEEIVGKHFSVLFPPQAQLQRLPEQELDEASSRGFARNNGWLVKKDGTPLWIRGELSVVKNQEGKVVSFVKLIHDFTDNKKLENELQDAQSFTQGVIETMREGLVVLDEKMDVVLANHCFYKMFQVGASETIGKSLFLLGNGQWNIPKLKELLEKVLPENNPFENFEVEHSFPYIGNRVMLLSARQMYLQGVAKQRIVLVLEDVSNKKDILTSKDDFISMAAHELKTPLTSLRAYNQIVQGLLKKSDSCTALMYTHKMQTQFDRLNKLIFDLLDVSRMQLGKIEFTSSEFLLDDLVKDIATTLQPAFPSHGIVVQGKTDRLIFADRDRTGQVITNFIVNAVKYSPRSDRLIISLEGEKDTNIVRVKDFGVGIEQKHQTRIFERYYRVNDVNDRKYAGLGIGLYVSAQIIERLNGKIWVESVPGYGSTFSFSLPVNSHYYEKNYRSR